MRKTKIGQNGIREELSKKQKAMIDEALYYAVRENHNQKIDKTKTEIMRKALDIMKEEEKKPITNTMCNIALNDFFRACQIRGWTEELKQIPWLQVGE